MIENLYLNILIPILLAIIVNGIVYMFGFNKNSEKNNILLPPGYIIGVIWIVIFGMLGYVHYLIYKLTNKVTFLSTLIIIFIIFCSIYPFLTNGLNEKKSVLLNTITLIFAFSLSLLIITKSIYIFMFLIPLLLWICYVNIIQSISCSNLIK